MSKRAQFFNGPKGENLKPWYSVKALAESETEICIYEFIGYDWWTGEGVEGKKFADDLKKIPKGTKIKLRINSPGGNVHDGILIYNLMSERRDDVTVIVDGVAASIASVIALCGKSLEMPRNTLFMIHDPWGLVQGNADEMRSAADMLDKHRDAICSVYEKRTGKTAKEIQKAMSDETWFTGDEAKDYGFATVVTDEISFQASASLSGFKRVPERLKTQKNSASGGGKEHTMDKAKVIAHLRKHGIEIADSATEDEIYAAMEKLAEQRKADKANKNKKAKAKIKPRVSSTGSVEVEDELADPDGDVATTDDDEPAPRNRIADFQAAVTAGVEAATKPLREQVKALNDKNEKERKQRIEAAVDECIAQDRIPAPQREKWVARALADEAVLDDIRVMEPRRPGGDPLNLVIMGEAPKDIANGIIKMRAPLASMMKGNSVDGKIVAANAVAMATAIQLHRKKLDAVLNTNTVDTDLKRNVILNDLMEAFQRKIINLAVFSTRFQNVPLQGTNKVVVPYYPLDTTASKDFVQASGYVFDHDTNTGSKEVTVNKRKYKPLTFNSEELRRQPYFRPEKNMEQMIAQLGLDVWLDILSIITSANYGAPVHDAEPGTFDVDDMVQLRNRANKLDWPDVGRSAVLSSDHEAALLADDTLKLVLNSGTDKALRDGATGKLLGFDMYYSIRIPTNSEDLGGFICMPSAALVATAPIMPAPGVRAKLDTYDLVVHPQTGVSFEYRAWGEAQADSDRQVAEVNYGFDVGELAALRRITNGAVQQSSSSSQSSVNSSSSSSSSSN